MKHDPLGNFVAKMDREKERVADMVLSGSCPDYVSYREMVANYKVLRAAIETATQAFSGDEDED